MLSLKGLLNHAVKRAGISQQVRSANVVQAVSDFLDVALLPDLRPAVHVVSFANGLLKIACDHSVAANETKALESGMIEVAMTADPQVQIRHVLIITQSRSTYDL
ncbi:MAG: hypothetical protein AAB337_01555 [Patescibacteria group bacterium]